MENALVLSVFAWRSVVMAADFEAANQVLRDGAIQYGNVHFDPATSLVRRADMGRLDVCQHSLEYAAALFSADQQIDRANSIIAAVLTYQDVQEGSKTFGNFRWWHSGLPTRRRMDSPNTTARATTAASLSPAGPYNRPDHCTRSSTASPYGRWPTGWTTLITE